MGEEMDKETTTEMEEEFDKEKEKDMGTMLQYMWEMMVDEDMGEFWDEEDDKEAMKLKVAMLMKKVTRVFRKIMSEMKNQFGGSAMNGNLPDVLERILYRMEEGEMEDEDEECCPYKKIWGSMNPKHDGAYELVSRWEGNVPNNCMNSCVYEKKRSPGKMFCFAPSMMSEAECIAGEGQKPVEVGEGNGGKPGGYGSGMKPGGSGSGMKPGGSGSGIQPGGSGSGMKPGGSGSGMKPGGFGSGMKPGGSGNGMRPEGSGSGMRPEGSGSG